jgi:TatD DNase family protein
MFIDTHTHLYAEEFKDDRKEVVEKAIKSGIEKLLLPNIDVESIEGMHQLVEQYPENCYAMMGLHPGYVKEDWETQLKTIEENLFAQPEKYIAIGEIGMDLYWDKTFQEQQALVFRKQVEWAKALKLPIVIHARDAFDEIFEILDEINTPELSGIFHCFTGNLEQANHILNYGNFKLGIGGVLTYKKAEIDKVIENIDLKNLVLETDAPYLPPVPFRGKRNESSYILHIAEKLADVYGVSLQTIEEQTTQNALELFKL